MSDDDETHLHEPACFTHLDMDEAFCTRMRMAIELGLESAPVGIITTPEPKIQNTLQQSRWYASAKAATFGFSRGLGQTSASSEARGGRGLGRPTIKCTRGGAFPIWLRLALSSNNLAENFYHQRCSGRANEARRIAANIAKLPELFGPNVLRQSMTRNQIANGIL
jgi:hypothetical protein